MVDSKKVRDPMHKYPAGILTSLAAVKLILSTGKTTLAADRLGMAQPAISRLVSKLEKRLSRKLFERTSGRLVPTHDALILSDDLQIIFETLDRIVNDDLKSDLPISILRIAAPPTLAHSFVVDQLCALKRQYPKTSFSLDVLPNDILVTHVAESRVHLAITDTNPHHSGVRVSPFLTTQAVCFFHEEHPFSEKKVIVLDDLKGESVIRMTRRHSSQTTIDNLLIQSNISTISSIETSTAASAITFCRERLGVAILNPFPLALASLEKVIFRPLEFRIPYASSFLAPIGSSELLMSAIFRAQVTEYCRQNLERLGVEQNFETAIVT